MTTANYIVWFLLLLSAILFIAQADASQTLDDISKIKTSVEKSVYHYIAQSDASETVDEIPNVKTIVEKPVYYYIESPAYVSKGRYSREYIPNRENHADYIDQLRKNADIHQQEQQMLQQKRTQEYADEKIAENERDKECLRNTGRLCVR